MKAAKTTHKYFSRSLYYPTQDGRYKCVDSTQYDYQAQLRNAPYIKHYVLQKNADRVPGIKKYYQTRISLQAGGTWHNLGTNQYTQSNMTSYYLTRYVRQRASDPASKR